MPRLGKPTLCAANGHVVAGGMGLALSCDLVIAKEGADFWTPEINIGAFPYMIMSIIYRNVPRKKVNEMILLGERLSGDDRSPTASPTRSSPRTSSTTRSPTGPGRLASKSPVLMRLGHDAMYRQQDMALDDALEYLRSQLSLTFTTEDIVEGAQAFFEKREPTVEGALMTTEETKARRKEAKKVADAAKEAEAPEAPAEVEAGEQTGMKSLVEDLHGRREKAKLGGGEEKIALQHERGKLTARERIDLLVDPGTFVEIGIQAGPHSSQRSMEGKEAPADGVITGWGDVEGRTCCIAAYDFTVMAGSMGMTGEFKVGRLREMALQKRMPMIWLLDSAGARIQEAAGSMFAGSGHLFREEVTMSGVIPLVAAMLGPCAAGTAYIPGLSDFVPMVVGQGAMALAGPAPDEGGDRRGHLDGGPRRRQGPLPHLRGRRPRGQGRRRVHRGGQGYLSYFPVQLRGEAAGARDRRSRRPDVGDAARHRPRVVAAALRHVRRDPRDRRRRRVCSTSSRSSRRR